MYLAIVFEYGRGKNSQGRTSCRRIQVADRDEMVLFPRFLADPRYYAFVGENQIVIE
jgi:hypothetical protein